MGYKLLDGSLLLETIIHHTTSLFSLWWPVVFSEAVFSCKGFAEHSHHRVLWNEFSQRLLSTKINGFWLVPFKDFHVDLAWVDLWWLGWDSSSLPSASPPNALPLRHQAPTRGLRQLLLFIYPDFSSLFFYQVSNKNRIGQCWFTMMYVPSSITVWKLSAHVSINFIKSFSAFSRLIGQSSHLLTEIIMHFIQTLK